MEPDRKERAEEHKQSRFPVELAPASEVEGRGDGTEKNTGKKRDQELGNQMLAQFSDEPSQHAGRAAREEPERDAHRRDCRIGSAITRCGGTEMMAEAATRQNQQQKIL